MHEGKQENRKKKKKKKGMNEYIEEPNARMKEVIKIYDLIINCERSRYRIAIALANISTNWCINKGNIRVSGVHKYLTIKDENDDESDDEDDDEADDLVKVGRSEKSKQGIM